MITEIETNQAVHHLKSDCLSYHQVLAQSVAVISPTTTPAANIGLIYAMSGNGTWLSVLLGMIGLIFVSININQFASRSASPGSLYSYIAKGLGPSAGVLCGWGLILAYLFTGMAVLCGFANFGQTLLEHLGVHTSPITLLAVGAAIAWYMAHRDIQLSANTMLLLEGSSVILILILGMIIWTQHGFALDMSQLQLKDTTPGGVAMGLVLVIFGFSGFESATSLGDEAKKPLSTIPKAVMHSALLTGVFFLLMAYIEVLGFNSVSASLASSEEPLTFLAQQAGMGLLGDIIALTALLSFFVCVLGSINPAARVFFTMARHGLLHTSLGEAHKSNKTPHVAVAMCSLIAFLVPASMTLLGLPLFQSMGYLGTICTYGFLLVYILVSIAAPFYLFRLGKLRVFDGVVSLLAVAFMLLPVVGMVGIPGSELFPVPEYPYNVLPFLFLMYLVVGWGCFLMQRLRSPEIIETMEDALEEIHDRFRDEKINQLAVVHSLAKKD